MKKERLILNLSQEGLIECFRWYDESRAFYNGVVLLVHGMAEHIERYNNFAQHLAKNGYIIYGHNQRGHKGSIKSDDDYGYMSDNDNFYILVSDLNEIVRIIEKEYNRLPIYLFGHSMGSFVVQRFGQLYGKKIKGMILSGSAKHSKFDLYRGMFLTWFIRKCKGSRYRSKLLYNSTFKAFNKRFKPNRTECDWLNSDPEEVDKYINDKYCGGTFTTAYYYDLLRGLWDLNANYDLIPKDLPILILSGENDSSGGCSKLVKRLYQNYKKLDISNLTLKLYPEARHEILLDKCKNEVFSDCVDWLKLIK
ncbi:MAG: lysophospholipase [Bacilli bacterium]|nr:lysophospholipase [Bacilli bacterium]